MAEAADVQFVKDQIEPSYEDHGWTDILISDRLDDGAVKERVVAIYWRARANQTLLLVNTSESGSSRGNDAIYSRMVKLADDWDAKANLIEDPPTEVESSGRLSSFPIRRV